MVGYSDSTKDAGRLAAAWALFQAQEDLARLFKVGGGTAAISCLVELLSRSYWLRMNEV